MSAGDPSDDEGSTIDAALSHINIVARYSRLDSVANHSLHSRVLEVEMGVRIEGARVCQFDQRCSMGGDIALTARRQMWPFLS